MPNKKQQQQQGLRKDGQNQQQQQNIQQQQSFNQYFFDGSGGQHLPSMTPTLPNEDGSMAGPWRMSPPMLPVQTPPRRQRSQEEILNSLKVEDVEALLAYVKKKQQKPQMMEESNAMPSSDSKQMHYGCKPFAKGVASPQSNLSDDFFPRTPVLMDERKGWDGKQSWAAEEKKPCWMAVEEKKPCWMMAEEKKRSEFFKCPSPGSVARSTHSMTNSTHHSSQQPMNNTTPNTMTAPAPVSLPEIGTYVKGRVRTKEDQAHNQDRSLKNHFFQTLQSALHLFKRMKDQSHILLNNSEVQKLNSYLPELVGTTNNILQNQREIALDLHPSYQLQDDIRHLKLKKRVKHSSVYYDPIRSNFKVTLAREIIVCIYFNDIDIDESSIRWELLSPVRKVLSSSDYNINRQCNRLEFRFVFKKGMARCTTIDLTHRISLCDKDGKKFQNHFSREVQGRSDASYRKNVRVFESDLMEARCDPDDLLSSKGI